MNEVEIRLVPLLEGNLLAVYTPYYLKIDDARAVAAKILTTIDRREAEELVERAGDTRLGQELRKELGT
jgi:hypothetical protein